MRKFQLKDKTSKVFIYLPREVKVCYQEPEVWNTCISLTFSLNGKIHVHCFFLGLPCFPLPENYVTFQLTKVKIPFL